MRTDTIFYQLFQTFDGLLFELIGQPAATAEGYEFVSVEVKEKAFRFDGIFWAEGRGKPVIFAEVQFQRKEEFYWEFMAEIFLYLNQYKPQQDWQAVAIFARRSHDPGESPHFRELFASNRIKRVYLEDWLGRETNSLGIAIIQLILAPEGSAPELARRLAVRVGREAAPGEREEIVEWIETVLVYKFPQLSREEIGAMFTISDLKQTRVYQEGKQEGLQEGRQEGLQEGLQEGRQEGRQEGKQEGLQDAIYRQLLRKFGQLRADLELQIEGLTTAQLESLAEALLDFASIADLEGWLREGLQR